MQRLSDVSGSRRKLWLTTPGLTAVAVLFVFGLINASPSGAQSQAQSTAAIGPEYKYDVVSVKPSQPDVCVGRPGFCYPTETPGGFHVVTSLKVLIQMAFGAVTEDQLQGAPGWTNESRGYEIDARMDEATADALQKLSPGARKLSRQQMLQAVLVERFKLLVHREMKELPVYSLFVGKTGMKLQQSSADFRMSNGEKAPAGMSGGMMIFQKGPDTYLAEGIGVTMDSFASQFSTMTGRQISDKTGLTGIFDFKVQFSADDSQPGNALGGGADVPSPPSSNREFVPLAALKALGFRLESGKGPVEVIVIDHVERASEN